MVVELAVAVASCVGVATVERLVYTAAACQCKYYETCGVLVLIRARAHMKSDALAL
jgi:hypothetical protein